MAKRNKLKAATVIEAKPKPQVYDRRSADLNINARVMPIEVDDPFEPGAKVTAYKSIRDDPLGRLHAHGQIDRGQMEAGEQWRAAYEIAEIGGSRAIDPTKEAVDGGRIPEPFTDRQRRAFRTLETCRKALGSDGDALIRDVLGQRRFIREVAASRQIASERGIAALGMKFKKCLETLVIVFESAAATRY